MMKRRFIRSRRPFLKKRKCRFCEDKVEPNYRKAHVLRSYVTDKGKILPAIFTGACSKHQRMVSREIKRARMLAMMPFVV